MSENRERAIKRIFLEALELEQGEQETYVADQAVGNPAVHERVLHLLALERQAASTLGGEDEDPRVLGPYEIVKRLGEGGFGIVYEAEQREPLQRRVAIKWIKPGRASEEVLSRFDRERETMARMDHPAIARVFDAGVSEGGRPYIVMELVCGPSLTEHWNAKNLNREARLALFCQVCAAVEHAHQKGVLHRDLKPSNILVDERGPQPRPKVIDFGLAKAFAHDLLPTSLTEQRQIVGTPQYMSPEQASLGSREVDTRSDVYSLGVLLYELLTGSRPIDPDDTSDLLQVLRSIREHEPKRPSRLALDLPRDLELIALKALRKDPCERYQSAGALLMDLQRYQAHRPIEARPPSVAYWLSRAMRRNPLAAGLAMLALVSLLLGITFTTYGFLRALEGERRANEGERLAQEERALADERAVRIGHLVYAQLLEGTEEAWRSGRRARAHELLETCLPEDRQWEWRWLARMLEDRTLPHPGLSTLPEPDPHRIELADPMRDQIVVGSREGVLTFLAAGDRRQRARFVPDRSHRRGIRALALSPDGRYLAAAERSGAVALWDPETTALLWREPVHRAALHSVVFTQDGSQLSTLAEDGTLHLLSRDDGKVQRSTLVQPGEFVHLEPLEGTNGCVLVRADGTRRRLAWEDTQRGAALIGHTGEVLEARILEPGRGVLSAGLDGSLRWWDPDRLTERKRVEAHASGVLSLDVSPRGDRACTLGQDFVLRLWKLPELELLWSRPLAWGARHPQFHWNGELLLCSPARSAGGETRQGTIAAWDLETGEVQWLLEGHRNWVYRFAFTGDLLATTSEDGRVLLWNLSERRLRVSLEEQCPSASTCAAFDRDDLRLVVGYGDGRVCFWDLETRSVTRTIFAHQAKVENLWLDTHARRLVTCSFEDDEMRIWNLDTGERLHSLSTGSGGLRSLAFDPHRDRFVSAGRDGHLMLWETRSPNDADAIARRRALSEQRARRDIELDIERDLRAVQDAFAAGLEEEAEARMEELTSRTRETLESDHPAHLRVLDAAARCASRRGKPDVAIQYLVQRYSWFSDRSGEADPLARDEALRIASLLEERSRMDEARMWRLRARGE